MQLIAALQSSWRHGKQAQPRNDPWELEWPGRGGVTVHQGGWRPEHDSTWSKVAAARRRTEDGGGSSREWEEGGGRRPGHGGAVAPGSRGWVEVARVGDGWI